MKDTTKYEECAWYCASSKRSCGVLERDQDAEDCKHFTVCEANDEREAE